MNTLRKHTLGISIFFIPVMLAALLMGCDSTPQEKAPTGKTVVGKPVIGVLLYRKDDAYIEQVANAIQEHLSGWADVELLYAGLDQSIQNDQIDTLLKKNVTALAVNIVDTQAAAKVVDAIKKTNIPVVFFNREPDLDRLKGYNKSRFIGTIASDAGSMQGEIIAELWRKHPNYDKNEDGKCQYVMLQANLDNPEAVARTQYSVKQAREEGLSMQQVGEALLCNWDDTMAYEAIQRIIPSQGAVIEFIIANNDAMALGAIKALNESGYNHEGGDPSRFIPVIGVDAVPQAVEAIQKGMMSGTVVQDAQAMGKTIVAMLMNMVNNADYLKDIPYGWDDSGIAIRIPYSPYVNDK